VRVAFVNELDPKNETRLLGAASPALRAVLGGADPADGWVDFRSFVEINELIDRLFGSGDLSMVRRAGHYGAQHNAGVWRALFEKGVDVATFVEIAGGLWHKHYDVGSLVRSAVSEHAVHVELNGMPMPHRTHCVSVAGWIEGVFELKPGAHVRVRELGCRASGDAKCELTVVWD
jgi:predicted hydrocarbon binding protein